MFDTDARQQFLRWTDCLLDPARSPGEQLRAADAWCSWAMARLGIEDGAIDASDAPSMLPTNLATGQAISPQRAALCVREYRRTAVFLQAMDAAIRAARARFPGETIHVVEAGCGPLAALTLPFAVRYAPHEVNFTFIDLHELSLAGVRQLAEEIGASASIRACVCGDATIVKFAERDRPHVIACEVLRRSLKKEPQVAVTRALAPQLREGGFFLPERIQVDVGFLPWGRRASHTVDSHDTAVERETIEEFGLAFAFDAYAANAMELRADGRLKAGIVRLPPSSGALLERLQLFTRIQVFRECTLGDFECSLTMPERLRGVGEYTPTGGPLEFSYEISAEPGLRLISEPKK